MRIVSKKARRPIESILAGLFSIQAAYSLAGVANDAWLMRAWQSNDGLPDNSVSGVAQTPDGFLWVATAGGLMRFDGIRFQEFALANVNGVPNRVVRAMYCDPRGQLWLGMDRGPVVCVSAESTRVFTNLPDARAAFIAGDSRGAIWITYADGGLTRIENGRVTVFDGTSGWPATGASSLASDEKGRVWLAKDNQFGDFHDDRFRIQLTLPERVSCIGEKRDGGVWICAGDKLLQYSEGAPPRLFGQFPAMRERVEPRAILEDRAGAVWVGTAANGLFRFAGTNVARMPASYFEIACLAEDQEGNIWAGTGGAGLDRLRPRIIELLGQETGLPYESVRSACEDEDGAIWAATQNGLLARWLNGAWTTHGTNWPSGSFWSVAADPQGGIWAGTRDRGLFHLENGRSENWRQQDGLASDEVRSILQSSDGEVFVGTDLPSRLHRLRNGKLQKLEMNVQPRSIRALVEDANKNIWAGSADGLLLRVRDDQLVAETPGVSTRLLSIRCLLATPDGSLWIGYAGWGIGRLKDGKYCRITSDQGLYDDYISQMVEDDRGWLWCAGNRGIFQAQLAQLNDIAEGRAAHVRSIAYGRSEGFANLQPNYENVSGAFRGSDGRLWFPMRTGLAIVHTENVPQNVAPPPVILERVDVDGQTVALYDRRLASDPGTGATALDLQLSAKQHLKLRLPPNYRKLDFEFTALSFTAPETVQFRYRLESTDEKWVENGTQRSASFPRLPQGSYRFEVSACNSDGVWNPAGASLDFAVMPFYWQTRWFQAGALLAFTLSLIAIVRYVSFRRLRRQLAVLEQQAGLQRERARIAKDIHDDLGASLTQIALLGELAQQDRGEPDRAAERIGRISATARGAIKSLDEIVWAVNPRNDTLAHLMDYAGQFALDYLRLADIRCRLDFPEQSPPREISTDLRHNLFLVIKESLHNIVKHAQASEVWLRIRFSGDALHISIEDNGRGFDREPDDAVADGLRNMRQRMEDIGGEFSFESRAGAGTKIVLRLPWPRELEGS